MMTEKDLIGFWADRTKRLFGSRSRICESEEGLSALLNADDTVYFSPSVLQIREIYNTLNRGLFSSSLPSDLPIMKITSFEPINACISYDRNPNGVLEYNDKHKHTMKSLVSIIAHEMCHVFDKSDYRLHANVHGKVFEKIWKEMVVVSGITDYDNSILNLDNHEVLQWVNEHHAYERLLVLSGPTGEYSVKGGIAVKIRTNLVQPSIRYIIRHRCLDFDGLYDIDGVNLIRVYSIGVPYNGREDAFIGLKSSAIGKSRLNRYYFDVLNGRYGNYELEFEKKLG